MRLEHFLSAASGTVLVLLMVLIFHETSGQTNRKLYDAHGHLSIYEGSPLDSLMKYGIYGIRDCGGDYFKLKRLRDEINSGVRKGPKIFISDPFLDGPNKSPLRGHLTLTITTKIEAVKAVDSLAKLGVDFIKTHNGLTRENYFAILEQAKLRNIKVVSHLPRGVPIWEAVNGGVSCVEHVSESVLASPIYAGYVKTPEDAGNWWLTSPTADSIIQIMVKQRAFVTPTLVAFETLINVTNDIEIKKKLEAGFSTLKQITLKLHRQGIIILAGSDFYSDAQRGINIVPGLSLLREIALLQEAGLTRKESVATASINFERWLKSR